MIDVMVSCNDEQRYPARIDPDVQKDGYVKPWFDLATVRRIAVDTQADAARFGHGSVDTVHVMEGVVDGDSYAVVLSICWMYLDDDERRECATEVAQPNDEGRYAVGGLDWCWYVLDENLNPVIPFQREPEQKAP